MEARWPWSAWYDGSARSFGIKAILRDWRRTLARARRSDIAVPQGDKSKYTEEQKRKAGHIEEGYEKRGVPEKDAEARAWATVNKEDGGGKKPGGGGRGKSEDHEPARKGAEKRAASRNAADRSAAAKKGWETRRKKATA